MPNGKLALSSAEVNRRHAADADEVAGGQGPPVQILRPEKRSLEVGVTLIVAPASAFDQRFRRNT